MMAPMKERPILFSAPMVRALLAGTKTQTRRIFKGTTEHKGPYNPAYMDAHRGAPGWATICPYGAAGDRLWVREAWRTERRFNHLKPGDIPGTQLDTAIHWEADPPPLYDAPEAPGIRRSSMFMCRWMSRITLEITEVRVQRLQDITEEDAIAEGFDTTLKTCARGWYRGVWNSINAKPRYVKGAGFGGETAKLASDTAWADNPWVWALTFRRVDA
jgi:hypothetical protein